VVSARGRIDPCIKATRAGAGRGIHVHPGQVEHFRVLQGRLTVLVGEQELTLGPGDERTVQPGTAHRWRAAEAGAQFLVRMTPGLRFEARSRPLTPCTTAAS
jgi:mannose-6-phosphate isomerase-like protein (cupin superfamily)